MDSSRPHALTLDAAAATALVAALGHAPFRAKQVLEWVFRHGVLDPARMTSLPGDLRAGLLERLAWGLPELRDRLDADDRSFKLLLGSPRGLVETVVMRYEERTSVCVSSQVGCRLGCRFCQTGRLGFVRDLSAAEILAQVALANALLATEGRRVSHVVFMGMGEPLENYAAVVAAVRRLVSSDGFGLRPRNVTVSTVGLPDGIRRLAVDVRCGLAVSLHAARDDLRAALMPIAKTTPLGELKAALLDWQRTTGDRLTLEYLLIRDVNCGRREARELVRFVHGLRVKVNLIPFNAFPGLSYERPDADTIRAFQTYLADRSIPAPVRHSKGLDISAACGQLAAKSLESLTSLPSRGRLLDRDVE